MEKQAVNSAKDAALKDQQFDLQYKFSKMTDAQKTSVGQYLNAYNLAAWLYNEICDEDCRVYIDLAMKFTMETQRLNENMSNLSDDPNEVEDLANKINYGEQDL